MIRINWQSEPPQGLEQTDANIAACRARGLPGLSFFTARPPLAVVGGGPSLADHLAELKAWPGDMWVSGSAFPWALEHGLRASFFTIDQHTDLAAQGKGAKHAILASCCDPLTFDTLLADGCAIEVFDLVHDTPETTNHNATTITAAPWVAPTMGYSDVTFFGCDSSYRGEQTHAYPDEYDHDVLTVFCNGGFFDTNPGMLMQAIFMEVVIRRFPSVFKVRGDGLLAAMVEKPAYFVQSCRPRLARKVLNSAFGVELPEFQE